MIYKRICGVNFTTSWDDGSIYDLRLVKLLKEFDLPATFYIAPGYVVERRLKEEDIKKIAKNKLFELGGHTMSHRILTSLSKKERYNEINDGREWLEAINPKTKYITSFCYPKGKYNDEIIQDVKDAGFLEARTVDVFNIDPPTDMYRIKPTIHIYSRKEYNGDEWLNQAMVWFTKAAGVDGYFHLWGHSWEIEKYGYWSDLRKFFKFIEKNV